MCGLTAASAASAAKVTRLSHVLARELCALHSRPDWLSRFMLLSVAPARGGWLKATAVLAG